MTSLFSYQFTRIPIFKSIQPTLLAISVGLCLFASSYVHSQSIIVDPGPPESSASSPTPTSNPYASMLNCSQYLSCGACIQQSACGWCGVGVTGHCIRAFNFLVQQGTALDTCYGNLDQYFWLQCSLGAKVFSSLAIAAMIVIGLILLTLCACCWRRRRRHQQNYQFDHFMGKLTKKYKQKENFKSSKLPSTKASAALNSPEEKSKGGKLNWKK
ncbi:hypothetical protein HMI54_007057 [Coelomomyces lativittatus]|nr:hypothetical protein HMI56_007499 [Coelomomyces lativittatus]KAJ1517100.1 hypothetical protein HMI54_007057 [Coelomomyces lativittatus]KAJ1517966.1 hypothetical protein HMI55_004500 [Coelomomyces lativittatus]